MTNKIKTALITGITGQDGALLAEMLLEKSYQVHGVVRRASLPNTARIEHLLAHPNLHLHDADVVDAAAMLALVLRVRPDEIYNLAAQSDVHLSFTMPTYTLEANTKGTLNLLEAMRLLPKDSCQLYQASTSEIFGNSDGEAKNETSRFEPCSPYGVSKLSAYWLVANYRQAYGLFATNGILFNHESPLRGECFVTRKITKAVAALSHGQATSPLALGNLDARRDWGHARDYVRGMHAILQHDTPEDFVLATGETYSVRSFVELAFEHIGRSITWQGSDAEEQGVDQETGEMLVIVDPAFFRPVDIHVLLGDASKAAKMLGWKPSISFVQLVKEMVDADIKVSAMKNSKL